MTDDSFRTTMKKLILFLILLASTLNVHAQDGKPVTIGIFTDCQYCYCPTRGIRYYSHSLLKLDSCIREFNSRSPDCIFHLGDMIDHDFESYDSVLPRFRQFKAPLYLVLGNHDYMIKSRYKEGLTEYLGIKESYYTVDIGKWTFIVLNGDDLSYFAPQTTKQKAERNEMVGTLYSGLRLNGMPWNGGIGSGQMKWLNNELYKAQAAGKNVVVMCHFPLFSKRDHILFNNEEVFEMIDSYPCVKAYFCGHYHAGGYKEVNGIHHVNFQGMVNTLQNAFGVVTLTNDSIFIQGYGREPGRRLNLRK
jgi:predicted phosphodiesterase